jgi:hypothetical protein
MHTQTPGTPSTLSSSHPLLGCGITVSQIDYSKIGFRCTCSDASLQLQWDTDTHMYSTDYAHGHVEV